MTLGCGGCEAPVDRGGEGREDRGDTADGGGVDLDVASEGDLALDAEIDLDAAPDDTLLSDDLPISEDAPVSDDTPVSDDASPDPDPGPRFPFGAHRGRPIADALRVGLPQEELDRETAAFYEIWKARYLAPGCAEGELRVRSAPATEAFTVSEGQGYGMLIAVMMEGYDPDARATFDGLYRYARAHPSNITPGLMAWAQDARCRDIDGADAATDGDLDIAYALLKANRQWGSDGAIDYAAEGQAMIRAILEAEIHPANSVLLGDWVGRGTQWYTGTRTSDLMTGHFAAFGAATGEARWGEVADRAYRIVEHLQAEHAPGTGLVPDFVVDATTDRPAPAPADWLEGRHDGHYGWNACRVPWRLGMHALFGGDARAQRAVSVLTRWFREETGDRPGRLRSGYRLDGRAFGEGPSMAFTAPLALAAMVPGESDQAWLDALWAAIAAAPAEEYFGDSIKMLVMIVVSNNGWSP